MTMTASEIEQRLAHWRVARLAWLAPDGAPRQVPIAFARIEAALWSPIDGKRKSGRPLARLARLAAGADVERRVSVLLDEWAEDWSRLWWLRVDGEAESVLGAEAGSGAARDAAAALRAKYPQYATTPLFAGEPAWLRIRILQIRSWRNGPSGPSGDGGQEVKK